MPEVEISDEIYKRVESFKKIIDTVLGEEFESVEEYVELILEIGMERMLQDVLPEEEMLQKTMTVMLRDNPDYLTDFVARTLKEGALIRKKEEEIKERWEKYIF
ncbi:MAG: hypothetical protein ACE5K4_06890 [Candidatus Hydrothermarchaeota archaeon]